MYSDDPLYSEESGPLLSQHLVWPKVNKLSNSLSLSVSVYFVFKILNCICIYIYIYIYIRPCYTLQRDWSRVLRFGLGSLSPFPPKYSISNTSIYIYICIFISNRICLWIALFEVLRANWFGAVRSWAKKTGFSSLRVRSAVWEWELQIQYVL